MTTQLIDKGLFDYFRCLEEVGVVETGRDLSAEMGFFRFGGEIICYGQCMGEAPASEFSQHLRDISDNLQSTDRRVQLPFSLTQVVTNLRYERYASEFRAHPNALFASRMARRAYYSLRPFLPVALRKHIQRLYFDRWEEIAFPEWPVDFTVEALMERVLALAMRACGIARVPFVWFWPNGALSCVMMTHDVEDVAGRDFSETLMDLDNSFSVKSAFQLVPEGRYVPRNGFLDMFRSKGFEVNVHDLNHDGFLFQDKDEFSRRAGEINRHAKAFGAQGFRSGAMYRNQDWYDRLDFSYDMSVPNVANLEPQRGGCCTVIPYFIGKVLELPVTTIQDYSLFHILGDYSIALWKRQIDLIMQRNGLISFITHPDYLIENRAQAVYLDLLRHLSILRTQKRMWFALPRDVNRWWRERQEMRLVADGTEWRIEGQGRENARVAYATLSGDHITYSVDRTDGG